jgi:hypothetical protein
VPEEVLAALNESGPDQSGVDQPGVEREGEPVAPLSGR